MWELLFFVGLVVLAVLSAVAGVVGSHPGMIWLPIIVSMVGYALAQSVAIKMRLSFLFFFGVGMIILTWVAYLLALHVA